MIFGQISTTNTTDKPVRRTHTCQSLLNFFLNRALSSMGSKRTLEEDELYKKCVCSTFTVSNFYGKARPLVTSSREKEKINRIENKTKQIEERPLPSFYNPGLLGPPVMWKTFPRQSQAIKYAQMQGQGLMVFSFESNTLGSGGKRNFVVAHPRLMWLRLLERKPVKRCSYEVIEEHSVCKLYFDLEFRYEFNRQKDGISMVNIFISIVCHFLKKEFDVDCTRRNIIDLDSSTAVKFSRHLIFNLPKKAFATNIHVGNFVIMICNKIKDCNANSSVEILGVSSEDVKSLFVIENSGKVTGLFCDEGVYTKNRNFRCLHCTKQGKNAPLVVAEENQFVSIPENGIGKDEQFFIDSLVTTVDKSCSILTYGEETLKVCSSMRRNVKDKSFIDGLSGSPYQEVDKYIQTLVFPGYIRSWFYFSQQEIVVYEIGGHRYCYNVRRQHKSNGIMYVANLKTEECYQKCHDPDCRDFRSSVWYIPKSALFWKKLDDEEIMEVARSVKNFEDSDSDDDLFATATIQTNFEDMTVSDEELLCQAEKLEMWDKVDRLSNVDGSLQGSQQSSHSLSQMSNPWDRLSQLSTPDNLHFPTESELCMPFKELSKGESDLHCGNMSSPGCEIVDNVIDNYSDEEFVWEVEQIERQVLSLESSTNNSEVEFGNFQL